MSRPSEKKERREKLLPLIADAFSELGYRRATTAEIAARCGVRENILYRLWDDKKAMFLASIDYLFTWRMERVRAVLEAVPDGDDPIAHLVDDFATNLDKRGLYRIIHAALGEIGDPEIMGALRDLYRHNYDMIVKLLAGRGKDCAPPAPATDKDAAWAVIGLVTILDLSRELDLTGPRQRKTTFTRVAQALLSLPAE